MTVMTHLGGGHLLAVIFFEDVVKLRKILCILYMFVFFLKDNMYL